MFKRVLLSCFLLGIVQNINFARDVTREDVSQAIAKVYPALVKIHTISLFQDAGRERKTEASGSGVLISEDGYVVTNHHVAGRASAIHCVLSSREELDAELVGTDPLTDIAVIKLDLSSRPKSAAPLIPAEWGSSEDLQIGDPVLAMGSPLAISQTVTQGIIANREMLLPQRFSEFRLEGEDVGLLVKWIGHDAQILPGNSGGPLVDLKGRVVGINEVSLGGRGGGLAGAIPASLARNISQQIIKNKTVTRSWIGAELQPLLKSYVEQNPDKNGALISGIIPGSIADKQGIQAGDILLAVDEVPVRAKFREEMAALHLLLFSQPVGKTVRLKILRNNQEKFIDVKTELREEALDREMEVKEWGMVIEGLTMMSAKEQRRANQNGILIQSVRQGGPANQAIPPLDSLDIITEINNKPVKNKQSFLQLTEELTRGREEPVPVLVRFERKHQEFLTVVDVGLRSNPSPVPEVRKAWIGIATQVLTKKLAKQIGLPEQKGIRITNVYHGSEADKSGLKTGDILTQIGDHPIEASEPQDSEIFPTLLRQYSSGSTVVLTVIRDQKAQKISTKLELQPKPVREMKIYENIDLEFRARDLSYLDKREQQMELTETGVYVMDVQPGGWASVADLRDSDLIQMVNGKRVQSVRELKESLEEAKKQKAEYVVLMIKRGIHTLFLELEPVWPGLEEKTSTKGKTK
jgi:serine protease Do